MYAQVIFALYFREIQFLYFPYYFITFIDFIYYYKCDNLNIFYLLYKYT